MKNENNKTRRKAMHRVGQQSGVFFFCLALAGVMSSARIGVAVAPQNAGAAITIRTETAAGKASPNLYGIFIEDWCHQVEGGIYAEMVRNRSFDDTQSANETLVMGFAMNLPAADTQEPAKKQEIPGWKLVTATPGAIEWAIDRSHPLNENNPCCLRLAVKSTAGKNGIYNEGHCNNVAGIAVDKGSEYLFSCYALAASAEAGLLVSIEKPDGKILAAKTIPGLTGGWKKYELTLAPSETFTGARLFIAPTTAGNCYLDMVSLFPKDTWKNRPNGLRKDLMEMVAALKPSFVRFPGGCFVEGLELQNAWHWKKTIGPVEQRTGHWNIWGWRSSDGMGYFEYLQMCEDLGAEPLLVINDGISHTAQNGVQQDGVYTYQPMEKMNVLVQDAMDAVEYANGPVDSKWGELRAAAGHPQPFHLKMVEVGNENFGPEYAARYALFHDAFKARYPDITLIMDTWGPNNYPRNRVPDMRDIHRFADPYEFALKYHQFDDYDRQNPKVYFGEWCVNLERPFKDSLEEGLYEAVFLTGLEKNSDRVLMTSYAPLMNNQGWKNCKPNMISFDLDHAHGAPIYWLWKIYSEHRVTSLLNFNVTSPFYRPAKSGSIGVGTQETRAEFKDIRVTGLDGVLFDGNTAPANAWQRGKKKGKEAEKASDEILALVDGGSQAMLTRQEFSGDCTISLKARKLGGKNGFLVYFHTKNFCQIGGDGNKTVKIMGDELLHPTIPKLTLENNRWYDLKVVVRGDDVQCYMDGALVNQTSYLPLQTLYASVGRNDCSGEIILKVVNLSPVAQRTRLQVPGAQLAPTGAATVLTAPDPRARNTPEAPCRVVPQFAVVKNVSSDFDYEFPAFSATVLQLKQNQENQK